MATTEEVTESLRFFVRMTSIYDVDDQNFVINDAGERITVDVGEEKRPILLYQEEIKNTDVVAVLNPFTEGGGIHPATDWFYKVAIGSVSWRITEIYRFILNAAVNENKKSNKKEERHLPMELFNLVSAIVDKVDDTTMREFDKIISDVSILKDKWVNIFYRKKLITTSFDCPLITDPDSAWRAQVDVRKKTWDALEIIAKQLFNIDTAESISKYSFKSRGLSCPKLDSFTQVLHAIYSQINVVLDKIDSSFSIDLGTFTEHFEKIQEYAQNAKFMVQHIAGRPTQQAPVQVGQPVTATMPWGPPAQPQPVPITVTQDVNMGAPVKSGPVLPDYAKSSVATPEYLHKPQQQVQQQPQQQPSYLQPAMYPQQHMPVWQPQPQPQQPMFYGHNQQMPPQGYYPQPAQYAPQPQPQYGYQQQPQPTGFMTVSSPIPYNYVPPNQGYAGFHGAPPGMWAPRY